MLLRDAGLKVSWAAQILRSKYGIDTEMSSGTNVLAMTGPGDSGENFERLYEALRSMDIVLERRTDADDKDRVPLSLPQVRTACRILEAVDHPKEHVPIRESAGRICGEYLYAYPPGVPILAPGEYIRPEHIRMILRTQADGNRIFHTHTKSRGMIACLEE